MDWMPPADAEPKPGQFLLSEPFLEDPWFGRKVVFLCDHDEQGSLGFVLNNGMGRNLTSLLPDAEQWGFDHEVHRGGPVHADSLFCLHRLGEEVEGSIPVLPGLWLGGEYDDLAVLINERGAKAGDVRFFAGYAGWGAGQLEGEMKQRSWYVHDAPVGSKLEVVMNSDPGDLWASMMKSKGGGYGRVTTWPTDPSLN